MTEFDDPATLTDDELKALYQEYGFEAGDPLGDAIAAEIKTRGLNVQRSATASSVHSAHVATRSQTS